MQRGSWLTVGIVLVLLSTTVPLATAANSQSAETSGSLSANSTTVDAKPGERIPISVSLNHTGTSRTAYIIDVKEPAGFAVENVSARVYQSAGTKWLFPTVRPESSREMTFVVRVPPNASGSYELPLVAKTDEGVQDRTTITVDTPEEQTTQTSDASGPGFGIVAVLMSTACLIYTLTRKTD